MTSTRTKALIEAMDSDELAHYGVKGMKWGKTKKKDLLGDTSEFPHNGLPDEKNLIVDHDGTVLLDLSRLPESSSMRTRFRDATMYLEMTYVNNKPAYPKDHDWAGMQAKVNTVAKRFHNPEPKKESTPAFNENVKISSKIKNTAESNRREVILKEVDSPKTGKGKPYLKQDVLSNLLDSEIDTDTLAHYGVMGMKWGVRKDRKTGKAKSAEIDVVALPDGSLLSFLNDVPKGIPFNKKDDKALQKYASALYKEVEKDLTSKETDAYLDNVWDLATESVNRQPKPSFEKIEAIYNKELAAYAEKSALRFIPETLAVRFQGEYVPDANAHLLTMTLSTVDTDKIRHASTGIEPKVLTVTYRVVFRNQHNVAELKEVPVAHSALTDLLNTEVDSDELAHYGVKGMKWGKKKKKEVDDASGGALDETLIDQDVTIDGKTYTPEEFLALRKKTASDIKKKHAKSPIGKLNKILTDMGLPPLVTSAPQKSKDMRDVIKEENSKKKKATVKRSNVEGLATPNSKPGTFEVYASPKKKKLTHSALSELLNTDVDSDELAHYGVLGMKWGVRKDRSTGKRGSRKADSLEKRKGTVNQVSEKKSRGSNKLAENPQNRKISDAELTKLVNRIRLEKTYAELTKVPPPPPAVTSRFKKALVDTAFTVGTSAATEVGKAILTQALKVQYNKRAPAQYHIQLKDVKKAVDKATGS